MNLKEYFKQKLSESLLDEGRLQRLKNASFKYRNLGNPELKSRVESAIGKANFRGKQVAKKALSGKLGSFARNYAKGFLSANREMQQKYPGSRSPFSSFNDGMRNLPSGLAGSINQYIVKNSEKYPFFADELRDIRNSRTKK